MIPIELTERKQWICWKYEQKEGREKPTKVPYNPITGYHAKSTDATTWCTFETALKNLEKFDGIGFVFSKDDPYVGIDLDNVLDEKGDFKFKDAQDIFEMCNSYTEISPSKKGIHILIKAKLSEKGARNVEENLPRGMCEKEMYESGRYFTVTGNQLGETKSINEAQSCAWVIEDMIAKQQKINKNQNNETKITKKTVNQDENSVENDPYYIMATKIFTDENLQKDQLIKKAAEIHDLIEKIQIIKIRHFTTDKDIRVSYLRNGYKENTFITVENENFKFSEDKNELKNQLYGQVVKNIFQNNLTEQSKMPSIDDLTPSTVYLLGQIQNSPINIDFRKYIPIQNNDVFQTEAEKELNKPGKTIINEINIDIAKYPILASAFQNVKTEKENAVQVSSTLQCLIREPIERTLLKNKIDEKQNEMKIENVDFRAEVKNVFFAKDADNIIGWLREHGVTAQAYKENDLKNTIYTDCSFSHMPLSEEIQNTTFEKCQFDHIEDQLVKVQLNKVDFNCCKFGSKEDYEAIKETGSVIKNCFVQTYDEKVGKNLWSLVSANNEEKKNTKSKENLERI